MLQRGQAADAAGAAGWDMEGQAADAAGTRDGWAGGDVRHWHRASRDAEARLHGERDAEANRRGVQAIYSSDLQQRRHDTAA